MFVSDRAVRTYFFSFWSNKHFTLTERTFTSVMSLVSGEGEERKGGAGPTLGTEVRINVTMCNQSTYNILVMKISLPF